MDETEPNAAAIETPEQEPTEQASEQDPAQPEQATEEPEPEEPQPAETAPRPRATKAEVVRRIDMVFKAILLGAELQDLARIIHSTVV
jgi:predicted component of type VI protein secretion system